MGDFMQIFGECVAEALRVLFELHSNLRNKALYLT